MFGEESGWIDAILFNDIRRRRFFARPLRLPPRALGRVVGGEAFGCVVFASVVGQEEDGRVGGAICRPKRRDYREA